MKRFFRHILELYLKWLANIVLNIRKPKIIAITGSVGKSSAKEAIFSILHQKYGSRVFKSEGNLNEEIGVPLSVLGFKRSVRWFEWPVILIASFVYTIWYIVFGDSYPKILILELAAQKPGDIKYLTSFIKPNIAIITAVGLAHSEYFKSLENIIEEKSRILEVLSESDWALLGKNNELTKKILSKIKANIMYFNDTADEPEKEIARAVVKILKIDQNTIETGLKSYRPLPHRLNILRGKNQTVIIDDCYNANPLSMKRALNKLKANDLQLRASRRIAVLGDMLELGDFAFIAHKEILELAKKFADIVITVGAEFAKQKNRWHFSTNMQAAEFLLKEIRPGDIILIKGSRGIHMEEIVNQLSKS